MLYALIVPPNILLPKTTVIDEHLNLTPPKTSSENLDNIERIALSIGMSLALVPIVGLILNYTPFGIRLAPITLSLLTLTVVFATVALFRELHLKTIATKPT